MTPAVGQRWLWNVLNQSIVVFEITSMEPHNEFKFIIVQVIKKYYSVDVVGNYNVGHLSVLSSSSYTYLEGQDKTI
jgi:hypothetical protein